MTVTVTNPTNNHVPRFGVVQGPAPTAITFRTRNTYRTYRASFTRPEWMEIVQEDGHTVRQGWIDRLPLDAASALAEAQA